MKRILRLALATCFTAPALAVAQDLPVLHEYFVYSPTNRPVDDTVPALPEPATEGELFAEAAPNPAGGLTLTPGGPIPSPGFFEEGMGGLRNGPATPAADATLDRETSPEGLLRYQSVFEPSVSPWKRSAARDQIVFDGSEIALRASSGEPTRVSVAGSPPSGFDSFTGRVRVRSDSGTSVPIPSVAPDTRFHALRISPPVGATILRDASDNYSIRFDASGQFDVEFEVSAPRSYFGGRLPTNGAVPGPPTLPEALLPAARLVLDSVGIVRGMTEVEIAERMSEYFGSFEARELSPEELSEDVYTDIALGRVGVCRHRAMSFVITAAAAGLRARYVNNEAHAFVEVYFTNLGYRRIDLGGASAGLETIGGNGETHRPEENSLDAARPDGNGSPYERIQSPATGATDGPTSDEPPPPTEPVEGPEAGDPPEPSGVEVPAADEQRERTLLTAQVHSERAFRGDEVTVSTDLRGLNSGPIEGAEVAVRIVDRTSGYSTTLGVLRTGPDGRASSVLTLPPSLPTGRLEIELSFAGNLDFAPSEVR